MSENTSTVSQVAFSTPQCIQVDEVHAGNHLSLRVTPGGSEEWVRNISTQFTPTIGQTFATLDEGIQFYETYVMACGFEPRKSSTKRFRDNGDIKTKLVVCHREGFRDSKPRTLLSNGEEEEPMVKPYDPKKTKVTMIGCKARILFKFIIQEIDEVKVPLFVVGQFHAAHNHLLCQLKFREFQKKCRDLNIQHKQFIVDNCKVNVGPTATFRSVKEYVDGYKNIGACLTDFKNFGREIKCFIGLEDAQMFIDQLETFSQTRKGFYYAYDIDQNKCLFRVFWADAEARRNYSLYGEAVTFDPTYSTNRYDMIFAPCIGVDHHKKSVTFGASLMSRENEPNFKWIFTKFLDAMGGKQPHCFFTDQCPAMKTVVPAIFTTAAHRYCMWHIMQKLPEKVGTTVIKETDFVSRLNSVVWDSDLEPSDFEESAGDSSRDDTTRFLDVEDSILHKTYTVAFNPTTFDATCSCKMFERKGYICKHIIWILAGKGIKKIPDKYLLSRWTKNTKKMPIYDAHGQLLDDFDSSDVSKLQISNVWSEFYSTLTLVKSLPINHITELIDLLKTFRQKFKSGPERMTKRQELEMLLGVKSSTEVRILPHVQSKNKGSGKRLTSKKQQCIEKAQKPKRFCNNCKEMAHHDKRNCPNPAFDTSQHSVDDESEISSCADVALDSGDSGFRREKFFKVKVDQNLLEIINVTGRLNGLAILSIEKELLKDIEVDVIINDFAS
ncbi:hypothetical protein RND81_13G031200 [Saponaria officinalis]|uniref:SWIM-type domain-containing protein n=1 Tax=Saponaria officinalis TaxID=3572 RepID=A0AAW1GWB6_SAPOF